jgi:hypothetical protein
MRKTNLLIRIPFAIVFCWLMYLGVTATSGVIQLLLSIIILGLFVILGRE